MQRQWTPIKEYSDILFEYFEGIAKITINRPQVRNAFTPTTVAQMSEALVICRQRNDIRVVVLTGAGDKAFCSGGDMHVKGIGGYIDPTGVPRLNVLDVQKQIRSLPKPVIAMVNGFAIGGGHVLQVVCDLSVASENAVFGQTGPRVGSFDAGFGASYLARCVGQKKAREIWFMCRKYSAQEALEMGLINKVVPFDQLEDEVVDWAKTIMNHSALAIRMIKAGLNAELDGQAGIQELAGDATMLYAYVDIVWSCGRATPGDYTLSGDAQGCHSPATSTLDEGLRYGSQQAIYDEIQKWQEPVKAKFAEIEKGLERIKQLLEVTKLTPEELAEVHLMLDKAQEIYDQVKKDGSWGVHAPRYLLDRVTSGAAYIVRAQAIVDNGGYQTPADKRAAEKKAAK